MNDPAEIHPGPEAYRKLLLGKSSRGENRIMVRHLLAGCDACDQRMQEAHEAQGDPRFWSYDKAFASLERQLVGEPAVAAATAEPPAAIAASAAGPRAVPHLRLVHSAKVGGTRSSIRAGAWGGVEEEQPEQQAAPLRRARKR
jgi:hypothetical protein